MTRAEAAEILRVTPKAIDNYVRASRLPKHSLFGRPRFRVEDVEGLISAPEPREENDK